MFSKFVTPDALERAARTFVQATAGALLALLAVNGASWATVPQALLAATFAGFVSLVAYVANPPKK